MRWRKSGTITTPKIPVGVGMLPFSRAHSWQVLLVLLFRLCNDGMQLGLVPSKRYLTPIHLIGKTKIHTLSLHAIDAVNIRRGSPTELRDRIRPWRHNAL
jgi:hypothetical protein